MPCTLKHLVKAGAYAHKAKAKNKSVYDAQQLALDISNDTSPDLVHGSDPPLDIEICSWDGGVNHYLLDVEETTHLDSNSEDEGFSDLEGDKLLKNLQEAQQKTWKDLLCPATLANLS